MYLHSSKHNLMKIKPPNCNLLKILNVLKVNNITFKSKWHFQVL